MNGTSTLEHIDLEELIDASVLCEYDDEVSRSWHPLEAEWYGVGRCPGCNSQRSMLLCTRCKDRFVKHPTVRCLGCSHLAPGSSFFRTIRPI